VEGGVEGDWPAGLLVRLERGDDGGRVELDELHVAGLMMLQSCEELQTPMEMMRC
jgi:hypothetical protein